MLRRLLSLSVLTATVSATLLGATPAAATSTAAAAHPTHRTTSTVVAQVRPVTAAGNLRPGYTVTSRHSRANCNFGSEATGDAYRCFTHNLVIDPCWVTNQKHFVDCLPNAWSHKVARLHVTKGYDNTGFDSEPASYPWGVQRLNGVRCIWLQGASGTVHGKRISYGCTKKTYLIGNVDKKPALWRIKLVRSTSGGHFKVVGWVKLEKAWFGRPTRKG
jgi:hypothetical protein